MMNPTKLKSNTKDDFKSKLTCAKDARHDHGTTSHSISGSVTAHDVYANWDEDGLLHLIHNNEPTKSGPLSCFEYDRSVNKHTKFPSEKPLLYTGFLLEKDIKELVPFSMKLSFHVEKGTENDAVQVEGDGMIYFDHFDVNGTGTRMKNSKHAEYKIELVVVRHDEVGG